MGSNRNTYTYINMGIIQRSIARITLFLFPFVGILWVVVHFKFNNNYTDNPVVYYSVGLSIIVCAFGIACLPKVLIVLHVVKGICKYVLDDSGITIVSFCRRRRFYAWRNVSSVVVDQKKHVGRSTIKIKFVNGDEIFASGYFLAHRWKEFLRILERHIRLQRFIFYGEVSDDADFYEFVD